MELINSERSLEHFKDATIPQIVSEDLFPEDNMLLSVSITKCILLTCISAAAYRQTLDPHGNADMMDWTFCKRVGISLKSASVVMEQTIGNEGGVEVEKAETAAWG